MRKYLIVRNNLDSDDVDISVDDVNMVLPFIDKTYIIELDDNNNSINTVLSTLNAMERVEYFNHLIPEYDNQDCPYKYYNLPMAENADIDNIQNSLILPAALSIRCNIPKDKDSCDSDNKNKIVKVIDWGILEHIDRSHSKDKNGVDIAYHTVKESFIPNDKYDIAEIFIPIDCTDERNVLLRIVEAYKKVNIGIKDLANEYFRNLRIER